MAKQTNSPYINNPFMVTWEGLRLLFRDAQSVAIYLVVLTLIFAMLGFIASIASSFIDALSGDRTSTSTQTGIVAATPSDVVMLIIAVFVGLLVYLAIFLILYGVGEYSAAQIAKGKQADIKTAFREVFNRFGAYFTLYLLMFVKVLAWSLLFIVPGIIMAYRYILAGTVFFAENKSPTESIKRSVELTKHSWITTYGSTMLWNIITQGAIAPLTYPSSLAILYRQFVQVTDNNKSKPSPHWLSWLTLIVPIVLLILLIGLMVLFYLYIRTQSFGL